MLELTSADPDAQVMTAAISCLGYRSTSPMALATVLGQLNHPKSTRAFAEATLNQLANHRERGTASRADQHEPVVVGWPIPRREDTVLKDVPSAEVLSYFNEIRLL